MIRRPTARAYRSLCWLALLAWPAACAKLEENSPYGEPDPLDATGTEDTSTGGESSTSSESTISAAADVVTVTLGSNSSSTSTDGSDSGSSTTGDGTGGAGTTDSGDASATTGDATTTETSGGGATSTMSAVTMSAVTMSAVTMGSNTMGSNTVATNTMASNNSSTTGGGSGCSSAPGAVVYDFTSWGGTTYDSGDYSGTTFKYNGTDSTLTASASSGAASMTGTNNNYVGFGLTISSCVDASAYNGVAFDIGGSLGSNGAAVFQLRSSSNLSTTDGGTCGSDCANNEASYNMPSSASTVQIPWSSLTGGAPTSPASPGDVMGFQWQFHCPEGGACALNVTLDNVRFY